MLGLITSLGGAIAKIGGDWLSNRQKLKAAKTDAEIERLKRQAQGDTDADIAAIKQMNSSWKDEFVLIMVSAPIIMVFIPDLQPYISKGFEELEKLPYWYIIIWIGIVATIYGLRWLIRPIITVLANKIK